MGFILYDMVKIISLSYFEEMNEVVLKLWLLANYCNLLFASDGLEYICLPKCLHHLTVIRHESSYSHDNLIQYLQQIMHLVNNFLIQKYL